jgi:uncharacterized protein
MTQVLRAVLDTNVLVSALVFRQGIMATLREAWQAQRLTPLVSRVTATELIRVLAYPKFRLTRIAIAPMQSAELTWLPDRKNAQSPQCNPLNLPSFEEDYRAREASFHSGNALHRRS